jgi:integrase
MTIGSPRTWDLSKAQAEARQLKVMIDCGDDPRRVAATKQAAISDGKVKEAEAKLRGSVTLRQAWEVYVEERTPFWQEDHISAHRKIIQAGGEQRSRSPKLTKPGPLAALAEDKLVELSMERIEAWSTIEAQTRPSSGRLAMRLLKAFLYWCADHKVYSKIVSTNAATSSKAREALGRPRVKHDVLQREQLPAWFNAVRKIGNPVISAYLQVLLLDGPRREELAKLRWTEVDFRWGSIKLCDKVEEFRMVPLTPYVASLLENLPRRNEWVFSSLTSESGHIAEPRIAHNEALTVAGLPHLTLHGLRRSFATLSEWVETPAGIAAQIQGHAPQGVREQNYIRRPLDLLRMWHVKIEAWMLEQAGIDFMPLPAGLRAVGAAS